MTLDISEYTRIGNRPDLIIIRRKKVSLKIKTPYCLAEQNNKLIMINS